MVFVFLSYKSDDEKVARQIKQAIEQAFAAKVFMSADARDGTTPGEMWLPEIYEAIYQSDIVVLLIGSRWIDSQFCQDEFRLSLYMGRVTIPLILEEVSKVQDFVQKNFNDKTFVTLDEILDVNGKIKTNNKLFSRVEEAVKRSLFPPFPYNKDNPYKGLLAYKEDDAGVFFGREKEIKELKNKILSKQKKIYIIRGHSGVGKSSFMQAGILARMRQESEWRVFRVYTPEIYDPIGSFAEYIASNTTKNIDDITEILSHENIEVIVEKLYRLIKTSTQPVLIPIDQAELFVADNHNEVMKKVRRVYLELIKRSSIFGIVTVRNDLFDKLQYCIDEKIKDDIELKSIAHSEIDKIIRLPIQVPAYRMKGYKIDDEFVHAVKEDIDYSVDMLPLLSTLLEKLFDEHKGKLTKEIYRKGDIKNHIDGMAESIVAKLDEEKLESLKKFLLFRMVRYLKTSDSYILTQSLLQMIPQEIYDVIEEFIEKRLFIKDKKSVKITHESVLRHWQRLKNWMEDEKEILSLLEEIDKYYEMYKQKMHENVGENRLNDYLLPKSVINVLEDEKKYKKVVNASDKREFIIKSVSYYKKEALKRRGFLITGFAAISGLAIFGNIQYFRAKENEQKALAEAERANLNEKMLKEELKKTKHNLGLAYAQKAIRYIEQGYIVEGLLHGYKALKLIDESMNQKVRRDIKELLISIDNYFLPFTKIEEESVLLKMGFYSSIDKIFIINDQNIVVRSVKTGKILQTYKNPLEQVVRAVEKVKKTDYLELPSNVQVEKNYEKLLFSIGKDIYIVNMDANFKIKKVFTVSAVECYRVNTVSFFQNGKYLLYSCGEDLLDFSNKKKIAHHLYIWDIAKSKPFARIKIFVGEYINKVVGIKRYIAASAGTSIKVFDYNSKMLYRTIVDNSNINTIELSSDERYVAYCLNKNIFKIKNITNNKLFQAFRFSDNDGDGIDISFSKDSKRLALALYNDDWKNERTTIYIFKRKNNPLIDSKKLLFDISYVRTLAISPDGKKIVYLAKNKQVKLYNFENNTLTTLHFIDLLSNITFSWDSKAFVYTSAQVQDHSVNWIIRVVNDLDESPFTIKTTSKGMGIKAALSQDKKRVIIVTDKCIKEVWDIKKQRLISSVRFVGCKESSIIAMDIAQDGNRVAFGYLDGTVGIFEKNILKNTYKIYNNMVSHLVFSPDGEKIVLVSVDGEVQILECKTGKRILSFQLDEVPNTVFFSHDGEKVRYISGNEMKTVHFTKLDDLKFIDQQIKHLKEININSAFLY